MKHWFIVLITLLVVFSGSAYAATLGVTIDPVSGTHSTALGDSFTFTATASGGTGPYTYKWAKGGTTDYISGATNSAYTVNPVLSETAGDYYAKVTDTISAYVTSGKITIQVLSAVTNPVSGTYNHATGSSFNFTVTATSGVGPYTYKWAKGGPTDYIVGATNSSVTITDVAGNAEETYYAEVTDSDSSVYTTDPIDITIMSVVTNPASGTHSWALGGSFTFTATVSGGVGPYTYKWAKGSTTFYISGATNSAYTVNPVLSETAGDYYAYVADAAAGNVTSAKLTALVLSAVTNPVAGTYDKVTRSSFTFTVTATGGIGPYTYAWAKDSTPIALATNSSYTVAKVTELTAGTYMVEVTDDTSTVIDSGNIVVNVIGKAIVASQSTANRGVDLYNGATEMYSTIAYTITDAKDPLYLCIGISGDPVTFDFVWNPPINVSKKLKFETYQIDVLDGIWLYGPLPKELIDHDKIVHFTPKSSGSSIIVVTPVCQK